MIYKKYLLTGKNGRLNKTRPVHVYSPKRKTFTGQGGTGRQFLKVCPYKEAVAAIDLVTHGRTTSDVQIVATPRLRATPKITVFVLRCKEYCEFYDDTEEECDDCHELISFCECEKEND